MFSDQHLYFKYLKKCFLVKDTQHDLFSHLLFIYLLFFFPGGGGGGGGGCHCRLYSKCPKMIPKQNRWYNFLMRVHYHCLSSTFPRISKCLIELQAKYTGVPSKIFRYNTCLEHTHACNPGHYFRQPQKWQNLFGYTFKCKTSFENYVEIKQKCQSESNQDLSFKYFIDFSIIAKSLYKNIIDPDDTCSAMQCSALDMNGLTNSCVIILLQNSRPKKHTSINKTECGAVSDGGSSSCLDLDH